MTTVRKESAVMSFRNRDLAATVSGGNLDQREPLPVHASEEILTADYP